MASGYYPQSNFGYGAGMNPYAAMYNAMQPFGNQSFGGMSSMRGFGGYGNAMMQGMQGMQSMQGMQGMRMAGAGSSAHSGKYESHSDKYEGHRGKFESHSSGKYDDYGKYDSHYGKYDGHSGRSSAYYRVMEDINSSRNITDYDF